MKITMQNYEEWMIDYIEGNLSAAQEKALREFLAFHPELQKEMDAFSLTKLTPDTSMVFPDKASLKQEAGAGRVINMFAWVRYAAAAAAVFTMFIGIRYFGGNTSEQTIRPYAYEQPAVTGSDRKTDVMGNTGHEQPVASTTTNRKVKKMIVPSVQIAEVKNEGQKRELNPIQEIDLAHTGLIRTTDAADIKDIYEAPEETFAYSDAKKAAVIENTTVISLNDNNTVVDWWNDAVAIGGEVGDVAKGVIEADLSPFKRNNLEEDVVTTRNISIPGFNYYSRKSNN